MASFSSPRDPWFDPTWHGLLRRRGVEALGLVLIGVGLALAALLGSYSAEDPGWAAVTDQRVQNLLGRYGAAAAAALIVITGLANWALAVACLVWGGRLLLHIGEARVATRSVYAPLAVALTSLWLASLVPPQAWPHDFGLGGMFGDTVLGALLTALPIRSAIGFNLLTALAFATMVGFWVFVLGFSRAELKALFGLFMAGLVVAFSALATMFAFALQRLIRGVQGGVAASAETLKARFGPHPPTSHAPYALSADATNPNKHPSFANRTPVSPSASHAQQVRDLASAPLRGGRVLRATQPPLAPEPGPSPGAGVEPALGSSGPLGFETAVARAAQRPAPNVPPAPRAEGGAASHPADLCSELSRVNRRQGAFEPAAAMGGNAAAPKTSSPYAPAPDGEALSPAPNEGLRARIAQLLQSRRRRRPALRVPPAPPSNMAGRVEPVFTGAGVPHPNAQTAPQADFAAPRPGTPQLIPSGPMSGASAAFRAAPLEPPLSAQTPMRASKPRGDAPTQGESALPDASAPCDDEAEELAALSTFSHPAETYPTTARTGGAYTRRVVQPASRRTPQPSTRARSEAEPRLPLEPARPAYEPPPLSLLADPSKLERFTLSDEALEENARMLESVLEDYGVKGEIVAVRPGPVVTLYELEPAPGIKASRVIGLADDIARSIYALSARIATVPGRSVIGIELPNARREKVLLREILGSRDFGDSNLKLPLALGKDIGGEPVVASLAKMPHLLIAGTTGSGKSVAINTMILSLLYKQSPEQCRIIMIDPKMLELSVYDGIPHLLAPVVTDPKKAVTALKWVVSEMEERYRKMSKLGVRNIDGYNARVHEALARGETFKRTVQTGFDDETGEPVFETEEILPEPLPYIVVIVDEMADLMMVAGKEIEHCVMRLAQMARASGIHIIMATQRPSVDVITGVIKANFPTRISFQMTSKIDSRTILGEQGAEQLLGQGDMLYMSGGGRIMRVHGPFVSDEEVEEIVRYLKRYGPPAYETGVLEEREPDPTTAEALAAGEASGDEALYEQAVAIVTRDRKCSTSYIQRKLGIGYNKAARLVEMMEANGIVSRANAVGKREILVPEP